MASQGAHLPTELVIKILGHLDNGELDLESRKRALYNFCLVNRQWYSVGIEKLYADPFLWTGDSFQKFFRTLCDEPKSKKTRNQMDLGSMVHQLDLSKLVHQSSNSKTSRLLRKTSPQLRLFKAPRVSFSTNCLASLSKCQNLFVLDLSQVGPSTMSFADLKRAICKLPRLRCLSLPIRIPLTRTLRTSERWPHSLWNLAIGGHLEENVMHAFDWPPELTYLEISHCRNLSDSIIDSILSNEFLQSSLCSFTIGPGCEFNEGSEDDAWNSDILYALDNLEKVTIPADLATYFRLVVPDEPPLGIKTLHLSKPTNERFYLTRDFEYCLSESLEFGPLSEIWELKIYWKVFADFEISEDDLDEIVIGHVDEIKDEVLDEFGPDLGFTVVYGGECF